MPNKFVTGNGFILPRRDAANLRRLRHQTNPGRRSRTTSSANKTALRPGCDANSAKITLSSTSDHRRTTRSWENSSNLKPQAQNAQPCRTATTSSWLFGYKTRIVAPKPGDADLSRRSRAKADVSAAIPPKNPATTKRPNLR